MGVFPWPCVRHALAPKRLGYRLRAHCSPRPCARLPLPRSAAEQAGHEGRDHQGPPRGGTPGPREPGTTARGAKTTQKTTTTSAAGASHHSQPSRQHGVVLFRDGSPRGIIRHHELLTERVLSSPAGRNFPSRRQQARRGLIRHQPEPAGWHIPARSLPRSICWPERL